MIFEKYFRGIVAYNLAGLADDSQFKIVSLSLPPLIYHIDWSSFILSMEQYSIIYTRNNLPLYVNNP